MSDLISRKEALWHIDAVINSIRPLCEDSEFYRMAQGVSMAKKAVEDTTLVDAEPVRHGHWEHDAEGFSYCSECGNRQVWDYNFCPDCGARMDE